MIRETILKNTLGHCTRAYGLFKLFPVKYIGQFYHTSLVLFRVEYVQGFRYLGDRRAIHACEARQDRGSVAMLTTIADDIAIAFVNSSRRLTLISHLD